MKFLYEKTDTMKREITKFTISELNEIEHSKETYWRYCPQCCNNMNLEPRQQGNKCKDTEWTVVICDPECHYCGSTEKITDEATLLQNR